MNKRIVMVVNRPDYMRRFHGWATIVWFAIALPAAFMWGDSVIFVTFLSLYAIVTGHWSSWQSARVEEKQDIQDPNTDTSDYK